MEKLKNLDPEGGGRVPGAPSLRSAIDIIMRNDPKVIPVDLDSRVPLCFVNNADNLLIIPWPTDAREKSPGPFFTSCIKTHTDVHIYYDLNDLNVIKLS